jgi:uncharacterized membrane protein
MNKQGYDRYAHDRHETIDDTFDPIGENIETIAELHLRAERNVNRHQRAIEVVTAFLSRPRFLYILLCCLLCWILLNVLLSGLHLFAPDPAPFIWLQTIVGLSALLMTTVILITQNRLNRVSERRMQLNLQVNLLVEQKVTKLIELVEELRCDIPSVADRHDSQAEAMKKPVDPHEVLAALNHRLRENEDTVNVRD